MDFTTTVKLKLYETIAESGRVPGSGWKDPSGIHDRISGARPPEDSSGVERVELSEAGGHSLSPQ